MANPNKTVWKFRQKAGFEPKPPKPEDPFFTWFFDQVQNRGRTFASMDDAKAEFAKVDRDSRS